jgi:predicted CXXCH cytochrome family protein
MWFDELRRRALPIAAVLVVALLAAAGLWLWSSTSGERSAADPPGIAGAPARFVGSTRCADCHVTEYQAWRGSQHARAMQHASAASVLGRFDGAEFRYGGVTSRFFMRDGKFFARTDGPDGRLADFEVKYTFGVEPLQQYLVELPGGRLQALTIAWDARPRGEGGQRWFHLYPGERIDFRDELHWTRPAQNWNFMCADCHSTGIRRNFDAATDTWSTQWTDIAVGCEACHGPGSRHLAAPGEPYRIGSGKDRSAAEMETCAACHARRAQIDEGAVAGDPLFDHYLPSALSSGLYHADGQQLGEVFVWGSFLQSRKYLAGVTCGACHEPHTQQLKLPGNAVCTQCHVAERFDTPAHHHHGEVLGTVMRPPGATGVPRCVDCHMREATYMVVDRRRDHGFHVPRPDLTLKIGTPNACADCHVGRDARWAADTLRAWHGTDRAESAHFGEALHAGRLGTPGAVSALLGLLADGGQPGIVRASAIELLAGYPGEIGAAAIRGSLADPDPLVRHQALLAQQGAPAARLAALLPPMLDDPLRAIRYQAAQQLALARAPLDDIQRQRLQVVLADHERALRHDLSRGEAWLSLGNLELARGDSQAAEASFRRAISADPFFAAGYVNLADLLRGSGRETAAESVLREGLQRNPRATALRESLGLALVRQGRKPEALREFAAAHREDPAAPRAAYVYALALHDAGESARAIDLLRTVLGQGFDRDSALALAAYARDAGDTATAAQALARLRAVNPADPALGALGALDATTN